MSIPEIIEVEVTPAPDVIEALIEGPSGQPGRSVTDAEIDGSGHLILSFSTGPDVDVGKVTGNDGADGRAITDAEIDGSGHLILTFSDTGPEDFGKVTGDDGSDGVSITGATVDGSYHLILSTSTGGTIDAGYVRGPAGAGTGDVIGVSPSVAGNFARFTNTTAKEINDSGVSAASFATAAQGTKADSALQSITKTGNGININVSVPTAPVLSLDATLEAVANFTTAADKVNYWTGTDTIGSFDSTAYTRGFMAAVDAAAARTALVLGTAATLNTGTGSGNVPVLDGSGKLATSILPAMALTDTFVVASQAAMLALTAQQGDVAIRTDLNKSFILATNSPSTLADWKELLNPTDAVLSVAGLTGAITDSALRSALALVIGTNVQAYDPTLTAFAAFNTNGILTQTAADTFTGRTFTGTANEITITNGDGVSGNPTASLPTVAKPYGKQAIPIPAGAMKATMTNGAASGTVEMTTNKNMFVTLDFDTSTQEFAQFAIAMPKSWNEGTVTFVPIWSHAATTTNFGVVWQLAGVAVSNDDAGDVAFGTAQTSMDTGGTTNDIYFGPESSAITIAGSPTADDLVMFQIARVPANGSDTMAIDARLHGIKLFITTDAGNDA